MNGNKTDSPLVLLFVEGDTDMVFFNALLRYYRSESKSPMNAFQVVNLQSVTRYAGKMINKLQNDIIPTAVTKGRSVKAVCCSYDTDVFDNGIQVVNWKMLEKRVRRLGIADFFRIGVKSMIEDWLLDDIEGFANQIEACWNRSGGVLSGDFVDGGGLFRLRHPLCTGRGTALRDLLSDVLRLLRHVRREDRTDEKGSHPDAEKIRDRA